MAKARSKQRRDGNDLKADMIAVGLTALGAIILISLLYEGRATGLVLDSISSALRTVVGAGAYLVPAWILGLAAIFAFNGQPKFRPRLVAATCLLVVAILLVLQLRANANWHTIFEQRPGIVTGGGYVGAALAYIMLRLLGLPATYVVVGALLCLAGLLVTRHTVRDCIAIAGRGTASGARQLVQAAGAGFDRLRSAYRNRATSADRAKQRARTSRKRGHPHNPPSKRSAAGQNTKRARGKAAKRPSKRSDNGDDEPSEDADEAEASGKQPQSDGQQSGGQERLLHNSDLFSLPTPSMISSTPDESESAQARQEAAEQIIKLEDALASFDINCKVVHYERGPVLTRYEIEPERGVRVNKITRLADDLAMALAAVDVRVEAPIPGKSAIGIEVPNPTRATVGLQGLLECEGYQHNESLLAFPLGRDIAGKPVIVDLSTMPHLLIAGATGAGKSVCLHSLIVSLLMRALPDQMRLVLIDPKRVELAVYDGLPHLMSPVVHTVKEASDVLRKVIREMEKRYDKFAIKGVVNIDEYNELALASKKGRAAEEFDPFARVVIIIDELADLMMQSRAEFEFSICRLAQLARATGIHLVLSTQRPSVKVITGNIKANMPSRIALAVASQHDSRTILDGQGAEHLIGRGDMLYAPIDASQPQRMQGAFVARADIERVVEHLKEQAEPDFDIIPQVPDEDEDFAAEAEVSDELYSVAAEYVISEQQASVSMLQRRFKIGYARAGRLIDAMERRGIVGAHEGSKPRQVLVGPGMTYAALQGQHEQADAANDEHVDDEQAPTDAPGTDDTTQQSPNGDET